MQNAGMRTTLDLPDALFKHLKARAALEGRSLRDLVIDLVQKGLTARDTVNPQQRFAARPPVVPSSGPWPVDMGRMSNADLYERMDKDDEERTLELMGRR